MKTLSLALQIFLSAVLLTCHKSQENKKSNDYFPNTAGSYWEYDVYDSSLVREHSTYPRNYIVKVNIIGNATLVDGKDATVWRYQYPWGTELNYIRMVNDSIKVFDEVYSTTVADLDYPRLLYLQPLSLNKSWDGKLFFSDSYAVIDQGDVTTTAQIFSNCFEIYRHYIGPNIDLNDDYWFEPNVGMVKIYYHERGDVATTVQAWQLRKFVLK